jgi:ribonuclease T
MNHPPALHERFRGFMPVVVDVETSGLNPKKNSLLEMAIVLIDYHPESGFSPGTTFSEHILPFEGAEMDPKSLAFNKIDPYHPLRFAKPEKEALKTLFQPIKEAIKLQKCQRAVLVGHNSWFDLQFVHEACLRHHVKSPFHPFTSFDTATLAGVAYGQTVLAKALHAAKIEFHSAEAHSAIYDAKKTAELFCTILNEFKVIG